MKLHCKVTKIILYIQIYAQKFVYTKIFYYLCSVQ